MRKIYPEDLTPRQIHYLILERRRVVHSDRLAHFYLTGRGVPLVGEMSSIEEIRSWSLSPNGKAKHFPKLPRDSDGVIWIIDAGNNRVAKYDLWK